MKKILVLLVALVFTLGVVGLAFAADVKGTVTKIDGKKVTVKDAAGKEHTVEADATGIKVGDSVDVKGGKITKAAKKKAIEGC
jgi:uncharacterized protein YxeA